MDSEASRPCMAKLLQEGARERAKQLRSRADEQGDGQEPPISSPLLNGLRALGWRQQYQFSKSYLLDMLGGKARLEVRQIEMGEVKGLGTGANVWPAAVVLAKYLEKKYGPNGMAGLRTVDLGCGTGLTGLAAGVLGAHVYLTDQAQILFLAQENAEACSRAVEDTLLPLSRVHCSEYNWGGDATSLAPLPLDVVLVSDCLLPKLYPIEPLVDAFDQLSGPHTVIIVSYEPRAFAAYDPVEYLDKLLQAKGLRRERVSDERLDQEFWADDIQVWEIRRTAA